MPALRHTRDYLSRPWTSRERMRVQTAIDACRRLARLNKSSVRLEFVNRRNSNGFSIRVEADGTEKASRFISMAWAKANGYAWS